MKIPPPPGIRTHEPPREHSIQNEIIRAFGQRSDMRIWRANCGVARIGPRTVRFGLPGQGDVSGLYKDGRRLEIEVKSARGRQREEQKNFQKMIERFGGVYILARCVEDVHQQLEKQINGYERNPN